MAIFKCKMCGGQLEISENSTVCTCDYCGTEQTLPRLDSDKKANLYDRANHFRRNNDYDKAMAIYEQVLDEDNTDAEAYWSLVICKYGIEYVEDPSTHKRIPTVNRTQYTSIFDDEDYKAALKYADASQKIVYEKEANAINEIQKGILEISNKEEPFDVFICYKETDESGRRTKDSVLANDLYHQLVQEGFKVFFARITLEDKLGQEYEPYIFAALNSAKAMIVIGTKPEYFNAVWVKNEWSRYLALIKNGEKKVLIPAYKDMDPYDLPEEFSHLQAQDMGKLGFMQDLIRGIKKIIGVNQSSTVTSENVVVQQSSGIGNINALLKRGSMALEDGEWDKADAFFEEVLNQDAECADAYLGKLMVKCRQSNIHLLIQYYISKYEFAKTEKLKACLVDTVHIENAVSKYSVSGYLSDAEIRKQFSFDTSYLSELSDRKQQKKQLVSELNNEKLLIRAQKYALGDTKVSIDKIFEDIVGALDKKIADAQNADNELITSINKKYKNFLDDTDLKMENLYKRALERRELDYNSGVSRFNEARTISDYEKLQDLFKKMNGYKESINFAENCMKEIKRLKEIEQLDKAKQEEDRRKELERQKREEIELQGRIIQQKRTKKIKIILGLMAIVIIITLIIVLPKQIDKRSRYNSANEMYESGDYIGAIQKLQDLGEYKDSADRMQQAIDKKYEQAKSFMNQEKYEQAIEEFNQLDPYKSVSKEQGDCYYLIALSDYNRGDYSSAISNLENVKQSNYGTYDFEKICQAAKELELIDDGKEHNLEEIYEIIKDTDSNIDTSRFSDNACIKMLDFLNGTWRGIEEDSDTYDISWVYECTIDDGHIDMDHTFVVGDFEIQSSDLQFSDAFSGAIYYKSGKYYLDYDRDTGSQGFVINDYNMKANTLEVKYREDKSDENSARKFIEFNKLK